MISVVTKCGVSELQGVVRFNQVTSISGRKLKNLQCFLAERHVKCGNVSIKQ